MRARLVLLGIAAALASGAGAAQETRAESGPESRPASVPSRLFDASARWIWDGGDPRPVDAYRLFRRTFTLGAEPARARVRITADAEYRLYVNGDYVGRGPAPSPAGHAAVDDHFEVWRSLAAGTNTIAVIVHHLGVPSFARTTGRAGLIAELEAGEVRVVTDASWRVRDGWWVPTGRRLTPMREFVEHLDARREPFGWTEAGFDDEAWGRAVEIGPEGTDPWRVSELRDIPIPTHGEFAPEAVLFTGVCEPAAPPVGEALASELAGATAAPAASGATLDAGELLVGRRGRVPIGAAGEGTVVALDFSRELSGFPEITADASEDGIVVDLGYGEARDAGGRVSVARQGHTHCDRLTLRKGPQRLRVFHHRAFRYLVIAVRGGSIVLDRVRVIQSGAQVESRGYFRSSDALLDRIWGAGCETARLCMDQGFIDCPWRERGQYIGDAFVQSGVARYAFGDTSLARRFLRQAEHCQPKDGLLEPAYPGEWTAWMGERGPNRIPGYGALWIVMLEEHYRATGDLELLRRLAGVVDRQLGWFDRFRGPDGLLGPVPEWNFIDWADLTPISSLASLNLQLLLALDAAARIDRVLGRPSARAEDARRLAAAFHARQWDAERGLYRDAEGVYSVHTNALALLSIVSDPAVAARIVSGMRSPGVVQTASPYFDAFVLRALARHGKHHLALDLIRERFRPMVAAGESTLWETYSPDWSLCHGWSCEPTAFLQRDVLGLGYDAPARLVRVAPRLAGLTFAEGSARFACGDVFARVAVGASLRLELTLWSPRDTAVEVSLPASPGAKVVVDGAPSSAPFDGSFVTLRLAGGARVIAVTR